jgi:hypothetical protein
MVDLTTGGSINEWWKDTNSPAFDIDIDQLPVDRRRKKPPVGRPQHPRRVSGGGMGDRTSQLKEPGREQKRPAVNIRRWPNNTVVCPSEIRWVNGMGVGDAGWRPKPLRCGSLTARRAYRVIPWYASYRVNGSEKRGATYEHHFGLSHLSWPV